MGWDQSSSTLEYKEYTKLTATTEGGGGGGGIALQADQEHFILTLSESFDSHVPPASFAPPPLPPRLALFCFVLKYAFVIQ